MSRPPCVGEWVRWTTAQVHPSGSPYLPAIPAGTVLYGHVVHCTPAALWVAEHNHEGASRSNGCTFAVPPGDVERGGWGERPWVPA